MPSKIMVSLAECPQVPHALPGLGQRYAALVCDGLPVGLAQGSCSLRMHSQPKTSWLLVHEGFTTVARLSPALLVLADSPRLLPQIMPYYVSLCPEAAYVFIFHFLSSFRKNYQERND